LVWSHIGIALGAIFGLWVLSNAIIMIVSPATWFRLPKLLAGRGRFWKNGSNGISHDLDVRIAGVLSLAILLTWVSTLLPDQSFGRAQKTSLALITCTGGGALTSLALFRTRWCLEKFGGKGPEDPVQQIEIWTVRVMSVVMFCVLTYLVWMTLFASTNLAIP
jgi:hypothetical protein